MVLLDSVISQMDISISVMDAEFLSRSSEISILVEIAFQKAIHRSQHSKGSNIEFSTMDQQRPIDILLHYKSPLPSLLISLPIIFHS